MTPPLWQSVLLLADTFVKNPQYRIEVAELDNWKKGEKNILISLMQKPNLSNRNRNQLYPIGMTLYKVSDAHFSILSTTHVSHKVGNPSMISSFFPPLPFTASTTGETVNPNSPDWHCSKHNWLWVVIQSHWNTSSHQTPEGRLRSLFFRRNQPIKGNQDYSFKRDLIEYHSLEPGQYVVIPSTMQPYMSADFVLTVYCKAEAKIRWGLTQSTAQELKLILKMIIKKSSKPAFDCQPCVHLLNLSCAWEIFLFWPQPLRWKWRWQWRWWWWWRWPR